MPESEGDKLPYLQLYVADLMRDCDHLSLAAFGGWMKILCRMHTAQNRGIVRFTRIQLARLLGTTADQAGDVLAELLCPNNPTGSPVADHEELPGGVIELRSRRMVRDEHRRRINRRNGVRGGNPKLLGKTESKRVSVNRLPNPPVNPPVNPKSQSQSQIPGEVSPDPSSGVPPASPAREKPNPPAVDVSVPPSETPAAARRKGHRKLTDEQAKTRKAFIDWWTLVAWPEHAGGGEEYPFGAEGARNGQAASKLLAAVKYDLEQAKRVALAFLTANDAFIANKRRPLFMLGTQLTTWMAYAKSPVAFRKGPNGNPRRTNPEDRGEYREPVGSGPRVI
jgi:hypothetical protein